MNVAAEALVILDRWETAMDNPAGPPLEVHHQDLETIRAAITGSAIRTGRKIETPDLPVMTVGAGTLNLTRTLLAELQEHEYITLTIEGGKPVIRPYTEGWKVVPYTQGSGGMITAPTLVRRAQAVLLKGSRWLMERKGNEWRGTTETRNP